MSRPRSSLREYLEALLVAVVFALFVRTFVVEPFRIPSESMADNLLVGDHLLVNKFVYGPTANAWERRLLPVREVRRGDVVVFQYPENPRRDFIKRCVGLPGEEVELIGRLLYVDGERVDESGYVHFEDARVYPDSRFVGDHWRRRDNFGPYLVPFDGYFCLGDNRDNSQDARYWRQPAVPPHFLKGRALVVYWSFGGPPRRPGEGPLERLAFVARHFVELTRWERTLRPVR